MINDLKSKIPLGKKPKDEDEESTEEDVEASEQGDETAATDVSEIDDGAASEDDSLLAKLKAAFQKKNTSAAGSKNEDEDGPGEKSLIHKLKAGLNKNKNSESDSEEKSTKKKSSKPLQVVIFLALLAFVFSDYILPPEGQEATPEVKLKPRSKREKKEPPASDQPQVTQPEVPNPTTETTPESPVEVTSTDVSGEAPVTQAPETPVEPPVETTVEAPPVEPTTEKPTVSEPGAPPVVAPSQSTDSVDGTETTDTTNENITDLILEDLEKQSKEKRPLETKKEYVAPPDYEYRGRGLVYNCTGKHWACVDAPSYKSCEDNSSSVKYLKKKTECYPFNIYETVRGCENMQNRMVSSSAKTNFCNE